MSIRIEMRLTAICEECRCEWTPTQYTTPDNVGHSLALECPRCIEERLRASKLIHHFDEVIDLLN